jgi:hypothetical protein
MIAINPFDFYGQKSQILRLKVPPLTVKSPGFTVKGPTPLPEIIKVSVLAIAQNWKAYDHSVR